MAKNKQIKLSIIVVSYNTAGLTCQTLDSVQLSLERSPELKKNTEIFVVDNNSSDQSVKEIKKFNEVFTNFTLIENNDNKGFAGANNQAAQLATGEYLLLLNSDTIVQRKALAELVETAQKEKLGIGASLLLNTDRTIQAQGGELPSLFTLSNHMFFLDDLPFVGKLFPSTQYTGANFINQTADELLENKKSSVSKIGWVGGTAMLIKKSLWDKIGPLDENIFMYGEDIELCLRANKQGSKIGVVKQSQIIHLGSASSSNKNAILGEMKGYVYIWKKHQPSWQLPIAKLILQLGSLLRIIIFSWILKDDRGKIYKEALKVI